jgi:hypothetical protein
MKVVLTEDFFRSIDSLSNETLGQLLSTLGKISLGRTSGLDMELAEGLKHTWKARINEQYRLAMAKEGEFWYPGYVWDHQSKRLGQECTPNGGPHRTAKLEYPCLSQLHFEALESAETVRSIEDEQVYHERLYEVFSFVLSVTGRAIRRIFEDRFNLELFPHTAHSHNINRRPIIWLVFTDSEDPHYQNYPQIGFHVGIGSGKADTFEQNSRERHVAIKVAEFGSRPGYRRFFESYADPNKGEDVRRYFYRRSQLLSKYYTLYFRKSLNEEEALNLNKVTREEELFEFFSQTESIARSEGFFGLEILRRYEGEDLRRFEDHGLLISEVASNLAELIPIYFLFTKADPLAEWKRYQARLEDFRRTDTYRKSSLSKG